MKLATQEIPWPGKSKPARMEPMAEGIAKERKSHGFYSKMSNDELVAFAQLSMKEKGISGKGELAKADPGLFEALRRRRNEYPGIIRGIGFEKKQRCWMVMSDDKIVAHAKMLMKDNGISRRKELEGADSGLYRELLNREKERPGIMEKIGFERMKLEERNWVGMSDDEVVAYAKRFIKDSGLRKRMELKGADSGLYYTLLKREGGKPGIMEMVFSDTDSSKRKQAVHGVLDALDSFGDGG